MKKPLYFPEGNEKVMFYFIQEIGCKKTVRHYYWWSLASFLFSFETFPAASFSGGGSCGILPVKNSKITQNFLSFMLLFHYTYMQRLSITNGLVKSWLLCKFRSSKQH
jgi:hypothetical protein